MKRNGEDKEVYVIGNPTNPRCIKIKVLPVEYFVQTRALMTQEICSSILFSFNEDMVN